MKRLLKECFLWAVALIVIVLTALAVNNVHDQLEVAKMTETMKTVCIGRLQLDLPAWATVATSGADIGAYSISTTLESEAGFKSRVAARETEIQKEKNRSDEARPNLDAVTDIMVGEFSGKLITYERRTTSWIESGKRLQSTDVKVEAYVHSNGLTVSFFNEWQDPDNMRELTGLIGRLVANPDNRIPRDSGFCLDRAYFRDPLPFYANESITLFAGLPRHPDLAIMFIIMAGTKDDNEGLLSRVARVNADTPLEEKARITTLNASARVINGIPGEQVLEKYLERNFMTGFSFTWESLGIQTDVFKPYLSFELSTGTNPQAGGAPVLSSLSQDALLELWKTMSSSIRVRPFQPVKTAEAGPATPGIGAYAMAGDLCPRSGWWECGEPGNGAGVSGGKRQYFRQGQRMPQALLLMQATLWEKVRGIQRSFESTTPTPWKLVDKRGRARIAPAFPLDQARSGAPASTMGETSGTGTQAVPPVGSFATTGSPCPASGWWHCEDSNALDGARWFAQGSLLPAATFTVPGVDSASKVKAVQRRASWRLVRHAPAAGSDRA